jgi:hypothetical protein
MYKLRNFLSALKTGGCSLDSLCLLLKVLEEREAPVVKCKQLFVCSVFKSQCALRMVYSLTFCVGMVRGICFLLCGAGGLGVGWESQLRCWTLVFSFFTYSVGLGERLMETCEKHLAAGQVCGAAGQVCGTAGRSRTGAYYQNSFLLISLWGGLRTTELIEISVVLSSAVWGWGSHLRKNLCCEGLWHLQWEGATSGLIWAQGGTPETCASHWAVSKTKVWALKVKVEFWTQDPNSWDSICQVRPPTPKRHVKRHSKGRERRFITQLGACRGKRQNKHSAHLQTSLGYRYEL